MKDKLTTFLKQYGLHHFLGGLIVSTPLALMAGLISGSAGLYWAGATACMMYYVGREHCQAEMRYDEAHPDKPKKFTRGWNVDYWEKLDVVTPTFLGSIFWQLVGGVIA